MGMLLLSLLVALALFFLGVIVYDTHHFVVNEYVIEDGKIKESCDFVVLADLHDKSFGEENGKLFAAIETADPAFILIAGDMPVAVKGHENKEAAAFVERLAARWPVYYGNGNHETRMKQEPKKYENAYEAYRERMDKAGVVTLENARVMLPSFGLCICGLEIDRAYYKKGKRRSMEATELERLLGEKPEAFTILLAHNPYYAPDYFAWGADLTLCGHLHGGIMQLPVLGGVIGPDYRLFPQYCCGLYEEDGKRLITSRGLGSHTIPVRVFNPGELIVVHLKTCK